MSSASEPSVEVLTAEVRVLQIGSKPVTLSAARQLDSVDATAIKPFGRVRIDPKPAAGLIEVIGSANGILARSSRAPERSSAPATRRRTPTASEASRWLRASATVIPRRVRPPVITAGRSTPRRKRSMKRGWRCP